MHKFTVFLLVLICTSSTAHAADTTYTKAYTWFYYGNPADHLSSKVDLLSTEIGPLSIPVKGVTQKDLRDTWGEARSNGRKHEGIDIFAPRGTDVISPTDAVVTHIGYGGAGGNYVYTANPGKESFYYAHLEKVADGLTVGDELKAGDLIGYVGNSGNASGGSTHLHFTIYTTEGAVNPYERLMGTIVKSEVTVVPAEKKVTQVQAQTKLIFTRTLSTGAKGEDVRALQEFLITQNKGKAAKALAKNAARGNFGVLTKQALIEYQIAVGIKPASGLFGPLTRAKVNAAL
jgi:peptidoglycan LD-endopeptidase LytH